MKHPHALRTGLQLAALLRGGHRRRCPVGADPRPAGAAALLNG